MGVLKADQIKKETIAPKRERYLTHTENLMMVVIDFNDGPGEAPDPPHSHPHEQVTYVAEGRVRFFLDKIPFDLARGDMITIPGDVPHTIQLLTENVRLVDTFTPIRKDFLE